MDTQGPELPAELRAFLYRVASAVIRRHLEWPVYVHGLRLVAFLLIAAAIGVKNRSS